MCFLDFLFFYWFQKNINVERVESFHIDKKNLKTMNYFYVILCD